MASTEVMLNGFRVELSAETFTAYVQEVMDTQELKRLRTKLDDSWFLYLRDGKIYGLPRVPDPPKKFGAPELINCREQLWFLRARLDDVLPERFPQYDAFRRRPFTFLGRKNEIVEVIRGSMKGGLHPLVSEFKIHPKFKLEPKLVELREDELFIGIFMEVGTRWEVVAPLTELQKAGVDIKGLYVVRRNPLPEQRSLVGRIEKLDGARVHLSESYDDQESIAINEVWLEGTKQSFARCLKKLLGSRYAEFDQARDYQEANLYTGPAVETLLMKMHGFVRQASPIPLAEGLNCSITERLSIKNDQDYSSVIRTGPVSYCYDAAKTKRKQVAWSGIEQYGPFSRDTFARKSPKILVLFPDTVQPKVENFLRLLRDGVNIEPRSHYAAGFTKTFGLVNTQFILRKIPWLGNSNRAPAQAYRLAVEEYLSEGNETPDAAIVVILNEHADLPDSESPYLRTKALLLMAGVPVQQVKVSTIVQTPAALQYTFQNLSIALYAKMNGTPWTVDHDLTINDEIVIGMGMCELSNSRFQQRQRYIGVTTVFRGDGNYLLGNLSKECAYDDYPRELKSSTLNILREIKDRNGWRPGDTVRVVFHISKPLKNVEIADIIGDCVQTVGKEQNTEFAFLTVSQDHPFIVLDLNQRGVAKFNSSARKGVYAPERGTIVQLGKFTRLLSTKGASLIKRESTGLPHPMLVHLHPNSTFRSLHYLTEQVLKFTSLSWRSTHPARKPVTIYYSELIANDLARLRNIPDWSPAMLNVKLRASRWFL
jgi:hypothetical protein